MGEKYDSYEQGKSKEGMRKNAKKGSIGFDRDKPQKAERGIPNDGRKKNRKILKHDNNLATQTTLIR